MAVRGVVVSNVQASGVHVGLVSVRVPKLPVARAEERSLVVNLILWSEPHVAVDTDTLRDRRFARGVDQYGRFSFFVHYEGVAKGSVRAILHGSPLRVALQEFLERAGFSLIRVPFVVKPIVKQD